LVFPAGSGIVLSVTVSSKSDVVIIGAGASGLFCAAECARRGRSVLVIDHAERICSKVLISGGGRCNFTNLHIRADNYLSSNPHFVKSALSRFTPQDMVALVRKHRIPFYEKEAGQLFCTRSSKDIVNLLAKECADAGAEIRLKTRVTEVSRDGDFLIATNQGVFRARSLVIATGGLSYPRLGASGFGHELARRFGLTVTKLEPGLVPLVFSRQDRNRFGALAGLTFPAAVSCGEGRFQGNLLFTHRGLSGPAVLQASSFWTNGMPLVIDLLSSVDFEEVLSRDRRSKMELKTLLSRWFPKRFAETWCGLYRQSKPLNQLSDKDIKKIESELRSWEIRPAGTEGYGAAEVTTGGINTNEISSKTMEARNVPGLYCIGEVLDVAGQLGGYNLHWAWASGFAAGQSA